MKHSITLIFLAATLALSACKSSQSPSAEGDTAQLESAEDRDRAVLPLEIRIRRLPGVAFVRGVPVFVKSANSLPAGGANEPLYVVDGLVIGNSFRQIKDIVLPVDVKSIRALPSSEASFYGSRAANGVIVITTRKGN